MTNPQPDKPSDPDQYSAERRACADEIVAKMLADGLVDGVIAQLRRDYSRAPYHQLQDVVTDGFVALYRKLLTEDVSKRLAYVYKVAKNVLNKEIERSPSQVPLLEGGELDALAARNALEFEHDEIAAIRREHALRYLAGIVDSWRNGNLKDVMRLVFEAASEHEPLDSPEIGQRLGLNPGSVRVWKQRGFDRLAAHIESLGLELADFDSELVPVDDVSEEDDSFE